MFFKLLFFTFIGRPPTIPKEEQEKIFDEQKDRIVIDNKMVKSTDVIYYEMAQNLNLNKQTVYLAAKRYVNRKKLILKDDKDDNSDDEDEYIAVAYFGETLTISTNDIRFEVNIADIKLFDDSVEKMSRSLEWSYTFSEVVWEFSRLPCAWVFDRLKKSL